MATKQNKHRLTRLIIVATTTITSLFVAIIILAYIEPTRLRNVPFIGPCLRYVDMVLYSPKLPVGGLYGIDISTHQGTIDWKALALNYNLVNRRIYRDGNATQPIHFIIAKATEGVTIKDKQFDVNIENIRKGGYIAGAYHFYSTLSDAKEQAKAFIQTSTLRSGDIAPIIDVENIGRMTPQKLRTSVLDFISVIEEHYNCAPIIYTSANFRRDYLSTEDFDRFTYWIGHYGVDKPKVDCAIWQFTEKANLSGIPVKVDVDVFFGDEDSFSQLLIP